MKPITAEDEQLFSDWQRGLTLWNKPNQSATEVHERQVALRDAVHGGTATFVAYMQDELGLATGESDDAPALPRSLDHTEFRDPPFQLERQIYEAWRDIVKARFASQPLFWTRAHASWIDQGRLGEQLRPALLGALQSGKPMGNDEAATRNLLRRLGGLPHVRGKVSVIQDCPLSRCWWRGRIAEGAAQASHGELDGETAHRVLHSTNDAWDRFAGDSVKRITAINHASVRAAVICQYREASRETGGVDAHEMQDAVRILARYGPPVIFDGLDWSELCELAAASVAQAREERERQPEDGGEESGANATDRTGIADRVRKLLSPRGN